MATRRGWVVVAVAVALAVTGCRRRASPAEQAPAAVAAQEAPDVHEPEADEADEADPDVEPQATGGQADGEAAAAAADVRAIGTLEPQPGDVEIHKLVTCQEVANRRPVRPATTFPRARNSKVCVYLEAAPTTSEQEVVFVTLERQDGEPGNDGRPVKLSIGRSQRYRTYASFPIATRQAGSYAAVVRDDRGTVVGVSSLRIIE